MGGTLAETGEVPVTLSPVFSYFFSLLSQFLCFLLILVLHTTNRPGHYVEKTYGFTGTEDAKLDFFFPQFQFTHLASYVRQYSYKNILRQI